MAHQEIKQIALTLIRIDGGTQPRVALNEDVVGEYADVIDSLPPVTVYFDGSDHWLADGFHRFHAHRKAGRDVIGADVRDGTRRDAVLHSVGANGAHGIRRSNEDKRRAVATLLADAEWSAWSDRDIAKATAVSVPFVGALRRPEVKERQQANRVATAVRQAAGCNPITPPPAPIAPLPAAAMQVVREKSANDDASEEGDGPTLADLVDELQAENARLAALIAAAEADDLAAEAIKWRRCYENAQRQQSEAMDKAHAAGKREAERHRQLMRCGKAVGEEDPRKIPAKVEAMARLKAVA